MPVMSWEEHAERSLWKQHFDPDHWPHVLTRVRPPESEMMLRMDCQGCPGQVWAAWHPAVDQGMSIDNLVSFVEGLVNGGLGDASDATEEHAEADRKREAGEGGTG